jgi:hypothetical protein
MKKQASVARYLGSCGIAKSDTLIRNRLFSAACEAVPTVLAFPIRLRSDAISAGPVDHPYTPDKKGDQLAAFEYRKIDDSLTQ